jgi:hypothetical protein
LATHQLTGTTLAWWENYCAAAQDASTITWKEFVDEFRRYHIPAATMKRKADEFHELRQGNKSVEEYTYQFIELARYSPEEVNKDEKKQDMFRKSLDAELKKLLSPCIYPDFNTLMNMRKFLETKARQQDHFQKPRHFGPPVPRSQTPMQYRTQSQATGSQAPNTQFRKFKIQNTMKAPQSNASQVTASNNARACFNCRETDRTPENT